MTTDDKIIIADDAVIHPGDLHEDFIRSSGPGGQNVNKVATAVQLRFDAQNAPGLSERVRERTIKMAGQRATKDGVIVIKSQSFRSQEKNRAEAIERLISMVRAAARTDKPRRATKPTRASQRRRVQRKVQHGEIKRLRGRVQGD